MAIKHYKGEIGVFDYDDTEWEITEIGSNPYTSVFCKENHRWIGNKESLRYIGNDVKGEDIIIPIGIISCREMFKECTSLTIAPTIPEGVIDCAGMFAGCTSLTTAPTIPEGVISCSYMFEGCTSLTKAPIISEGIIDIIERMCQDCPLNPGVRHYYQDCPEYQNNKCTPDLKRVLICVMRDCSYMFAGCTSLTTAPEIPFGVSNCSYMFAGCTSLTAAPEIPEAYTY